ncbi:Ger(x)C family spore germination protein [Paenibacillus sp. GD4]|uniref:Ger(x)C family spore germination protein n=1 Tax=Paenibacillus sp. GD4 TaxID=3068890 RepID=UPI0027967A85|nr:Ger(x)C family spore germination protein [Paenibacillus sp. GD4]MDQ1909949.1 Ger(x)C family spore germination protein [Paenibacillus sp. GD4]
MHKCWLIAIMCLLLAGCWDRKEVNDVAFVSGSGIDKAGDLYKVTVQIPLPSQMGGAGSKGGGGGTSGSKSWFNDIVTGKTVRESNVIQQKSLSRQLNFSHRRIVVFGEELARGGLGHLMDIFVRVPQNRLSSLIAIAKGEASELLNANSPIEQFPSELMRELVQNLTEHPTTLKRLNQKLLTEGVDPLVPALTLIKSGSDVEGKSNMMIKSSGLAVFERSKLKGFINEPLSSYLLIAMGEARNPEVTVKSTRGNGSISVLLKDLNVELIPLMTEEQITIRMKIHAKGTLVDNESNFHATSHALELEAQIKELLVTNISKAVALLQNTYHSDPLGFGDLIHRHNMKAWRSLREDWRRTHYPKVKLEVVPSISIKHSGTVNKPFGIPDEELTS